MSEIAERKLSADEQKRISRCSEYKEFVAIKKKAEECEAFEVGTAVLIKNKNTGKYMTSGGWYDDKKPPMKFIIIENKDGIIFGKRVLASGKEGVAVTCLTVEYAHEGYEIVPDEDYLDSMLLDEDYNPMEKEKEYQKKKAKASRKNKKLKMSFPNVKAAYERIRKFKVGDKIWSTSTMYGGGRKEYIIKQVDKIPVDKSKVGRWGGRDHSAHHDEGFKTIVRVVYTDTNSRHAYDMYMHFYDICDEPGKYYARNFYDQQPVIPDEV